MMHERAIEHLEAALKLHQAHINGTEPTSEASQDKLMYHIEAALSALRGKVERKRGLRGAMDMDRDM